MELVLGSAWDVGVGALAFCGPIGWGVSVGYFVLDTTVSGGMAPNFFSRYGMNMDASGTQGATSYNYGDYGSGGMSGY